MAESNRFTLESVSCRIVQVDVWEAAAEPAETVFAQMLGCALPKDLCRIIVSKS
jgi:hypothetical protein